MSYGRIWRIIMHAAGLQRRQNRPGQDKGFDAMAHSLSAQKRIRQNLAQRARNRWRKARFRSGIRQFRETILHGSIEDAEKQFNGLQKLLDQVAASGTIHRNTASRYKSRLAARLSARKAAAPGG